MSTSNTPIGRTKWERCPHCGKKGQYTVNQGGHSQTRCKYCGTSNTVKNR